MASNMGSYTTTRKSFMIFMSFSCHTFRHNYKIKYTVKRNNNFMCIKTEKLKFLDITIYLAPGFSYSQYLKAYKCTEQTFTSYFPVCGKHDPTVSLVSPSETKQMGMV
jgi:hypothetical protein